MRINIDDPSPSKHIGRHWRMVGQSYRRVDTSEASLSNWLLIVDLTRRRLVTVGGVTMLFLPGTSGRGAFWNPVRAHLGDNDSRALDWPGLGDVPADPWVKGFDALVSGCRVATFVGAR